jgi:malonyl-CoA O-methyltransferase
MIIKKQLLAGFNRSAETYDKVAHFQAKIAQNTAAKLTHLSAQTILEIGCGTGLFSQHLVNIFPKASLLLTDISPSMLKQCNRRLINHPSISYQCMDGEMLNELTHFDLIVSSMTLHWFKSFNPSLQRITEKLKPGGRLLFAILTENSLAEWRGIYKQFDYPISTPHFPVVAEIKKYFPEIKITVETIKERYANAREFLHILKALGAIAPRSGYLPLAPNKMRKLLRHYHQEIEITYEVLYGEYHHL